MLSLLLEDSTEGTFGFKFLEAFACVPMQHSSQQRVWSLRDGMHRCAVTHWQPQVFMTELTRVVEWPLRPPLGAPSKSVQSR